MSASDGNLPAQPATPTQEASATAEAVALGIAQEKQYIGAAMAVCAMYTLGYLPGLIFNILWLREARRTAQKTGRDPSGSGCLAVMLAVALFVGLMGVLGFVTTIAMGYVTILEINNQLKALGRPAPPPGGPLLPMVIPFPPPTPAPTPTPAASPTPSPTPAPPSVYITTAPMTVWSALPHRSGATFHDVPAGSRFRVVDEIELPAGRWVQIDMGAKDLFVRRDVMDTKSTIEKPEPLW